MKNKFILMFYSVFFAALLSGCSLLFPEVTDNNYYDLTYTRAEKFELPYNIVYNTFRNISPAELNLLFFEKNNKVELDQYNFWTQSPENMLRRYMINAVSGAASFKGADINVSMIIFDFKLDAGNQKCVLGVLCKIRHADKKKWEKTYIVETPVVGKTKESYVQGMNVCVEKFVNQFVNDIKKL